MNMVICVIDHIQMSSEFKDENVQLINVKGVNKWN